VAAFREALRLGVSDPERAAVEFALALAEKGEREAAIAVVGDQAARKPDSYLLQLNLGTLLAESGRFDGALVAYRRATEIDPQSALAWRNRGLAALRLVQHDEAARAFTRSLALDPDQPDLQRMVRR
jgi:superkiller protein 3